MNVSCPDCRSVFRVDPAKVPPAGVRARCSVCSGIIPIPAPTGKGTPPPPPQSAARVTPAGESAAQQRARPNPEAQGAWESPPFSTPPSPRAASPAPPPSPGPVTPPYVPPPRAAAPSPASFAAGASTPAAQRAPSAVSTSTPPGARRPLNPFLSKDPNQRAKRLARALVSDIITYHPAKHAEGLRDGTLKQLFREEIKKSFEEYIAQVGQQLAESTTYFQEALNEVLGGGKKIF